jgi:hypothetical protein
MLSIAPLARATPRSRPVRQLAQLGVCARRDWHWRGVLVSERGAGAMKNYVCLRQAQLGVQQVQALCAAALITALCTLWVLAAAHSFTSPPDH